MEAVQKLAPKSPCTNSFTYVPAEVTMSRMKIRLEISSEDIEWITFSRTIPVRRWATRSGVRCATLSSCCASSLLCRPHRSTTSHDATRKPHTGIEGIVRLAAQNAIRPSSAGRRQLTRQDLSPKHLLFYRRLPNICIDMFCALSPPHFLMHLSRPLAQS